MGIPRNKFYVSAHDVTSCARGVYYKKKKTPLPLVHPRIAEIMQLFGRLMEKGQQIQKMVMEEWRRKDILVSPERFIPWNDYGITGKYDAIVRVNGEFILYEVKGGGKSIFENNFEKPEPYDEHKTQVMIYHYFLKKNFPRLKARLLYVERSGDKRLEIPIQYEEKDFLSVIEKAKNLQEALEQDILPEPAPTITWSKFQNKNDINMSALTCKYHALCLEDDHWYPKALEKLKSLQIKKI